MSEQRPSSISQTVLALAVAVAAVVGSLFGAAGAMVATQAGFLPSALGSVSGGDGPAVDRTIVELIEEEAATISVVDRVAPSVVSIVVERSGFEVGGGTGFFVTADGYVVTNRHVVSDPGATYVVVTADGTEFPASLVGRDAYLDVAVLDVEGDGHPAVTLGNSDAIRPGQTVIAIGNALSEYRNTVTKGVISGVNRRVVAGGEFGSEEVIDRAIQTDAAINPGNSGGPLINLLGEVVGINTAVSFEGQSLGFAIPANDILDVVEDIERYGRIVRPWLGVRYLTVDAEVAEAYGLAALNGAYVTSENGSSAPAVIAGSPAEAAGLREGDVVLSVNGVPLTAEYTLGMAVGALDPGDPASLEVSRDGEALTLEAVLEELKLE